MLSAKCLPFWSDHIMLLMYFPDQYDSNSVYYDVNVRCYVKIPINSFLPDGTTE